MARPSDRRPFLQHLQQIPWVRRASIKPGARPDPYALIEITTPRGKHQLLAEHTASHLSRVYVDALTARAARDRNRTPRVLFAPYVSSEMAARLADRGIAFVDLAGNLSLTIGDSYSVHVEGRRQLQRQHQTYQVATLKVLFALLVDESLLARPVRELAASAGVGKSSVAGALRTLRGRGRIVRTRTRGRLLDRLHSLDDWAIGYQGLLRRKLWVGQYQTLERDPEVVERRIQSSLADHEPWAFGGGAAAFRLSEYYRGPTTVVHVAEVPSDLPPKLGALPSDQGNLIILRVPGPLAFRSPDPHCVHPLLAYAELMAAGGRRAVDAATQMREESLESSDPVQ